MSAQDIFRNFDDSKVYEDIQGRLTDPDARNFVVEFGAGSAQIAFDLDAKSFEQLVKLEDPPRDHDRPVRWINIWAPDRQPGHIKVLAERYKLSRRFHAILQSSPLEAQEQESSAPIQNVRNKARTRAEGDVELGNGVSEKLRSLAESPENVNHYQIATHLNNYQSLDLGERFLCIGANYMYRIHEEDHKRLWTWLFLCDDATVISLHEDPKPADLKYTQDIRKHTITVLNQLSRESLNKGGSISIVSVRNILKDLSDQSVHGSEGSGNLFYYLFDNWHSTYRLLTDIQAKLESLSKDILDGLNKKHRYDQNRTIIPGLYKVGKQLRVSKHLYESYENIIKRILNFRAGGNPSSDGTPSTHSSGKRVTVALTASERFERLGDRIHLLVLSSINEAIAEKDALVNTYFNITAQKDSAATAKLSRNATLLSKLGVLFLPVSLMTSYFSVQIQDLQGVYTSQTYWICFGVIMFLSFIALFFLSRFLVSVTESLEGGAKKTSQWVRGRLVGRKAKTVEDDDEDDDDA